MIGVVVAKANSERFENKNIYFYKGLPIFWHNVKILIDLGIKTYVATNSDFIKEYCTEMDVEVIWRRENISHDEQPIYEVLKYVHYQIGEYDIMINILANTINVKPGDVKRAVDLIRNTDLWEARSYDKNGVENGLMVFRPSVFQKHEISVYAGAILTDAKEIHYERDFEKS